MSKSKNGLKSVTEEMLLAFKEGQIIDRYVFFKNIIFKRIEEGNVILEDGVGNVKKDPVWMFLKYAEIKE